MVGVAGSSPVTSTKNSIKTSYLHAGFFMSEIFRGIVGDKWGNYLKKQYLIVIFCRKIN